MTQHKDVKAVLDFIDSYWNKIIHDKKDSRGDPHTIPLPHTYLTTNDRSSSQWKGAMFYWDSFFMFRGLIGTRREKILPGMVDNFGYLLTNFGIIPNASMWGFLDRSQPPFFTSMIFDTYFAMKRGKGIRGMARRPYAKAWMKKRIKLAKKEYWGVWEDDVRFTHKIIEFGLNKYGDRDVGYPLISELESGWDMTTRFYNRANEFLPVDLNSYLHKYETDFARAATILRDHEETRYWTDRAKHRHEQVRKYMWNKKAGFYFDYDYKNKLQSANFTLAGFVPMWAKLATYDEAKQMREKLPLFETKYGLTISAQVSLPPKLRFNHVPPAYRHSIEALLKPKQWDYPHIWPPLEYLTVIGLLRYGFIDDAARIMKTSVEANVKVYKKYGALLEKLDATTGEKPATFWYPTQLGFGWTNAIFYRYVKILDYIEAKDGKIYTETTLAAEPPYSLTNLLH